jgi:hypothetical protein
MHIGFYGKWFALYLVGGLALGLGDRFHIVYGVLTQRDSSFFGQAWWVFFLFGAVTVSIVFLYPFWRRIFSESSSETNRKNLVVVNSIFLFAYCITGPFADWGWKLAVILTAIWVVLLLRRFSRAALTFSLMMAFLGPIGESLLSSTGAFAYTQPDMGNVHIWLIPIYPLGVLAAGEIDALFQSTHRPLG